MPRPDRFRDPHPIPTQRQVMITALDKRHLSGSIDDLLAARGFDRGLPYTQTARQRTGISTSRTFLPRLPRKAGSVADTSLGKGT